MQLGLGISLTQGVAKALLPEILLNYGGEGGSNIDACNVGPGVNSFYIDEAASILYTDAYGLSPVPDGSYADGVFYYFVSGGSGGFSGPIPCPEA